MKFKNTILTATAIAFASGVLFCINLNGQTNYPRPATNFFINEEVLTNRSSWCWTNPADGSLSDSLGNYIIKPWRIQLPSKLSSEIVTNWTTTSITSPVVPQSEQFFAVYRPDMLNQTGIITSNTVATIEWHGKSVTVILETVQIGTAARTTYKSVGQ